jgi:hypothetical protein
MLSKSFKNERVALIVAALVFALLGTLQILRAWFGISVEVDGRSLPVWLSAFVGLGALFMSLWLGAILRRIGPAH